MWVQSSQLILDVIFPPRCLSCRRWGDWVCADCWQRIELIATPICYKCNRLSPGWKVCTSCRPGASAQRMIVCGYWQSPLKQLVYGLKYRRAKPLADKLGKLLADAIQSLVQNDEVIVVPVPLHRGRLWERGFNQAELLARVVATELERPLVRLLVRQRFTLPQFKLTKIARRENVQAAFAIRLSQAPQITNKTVLLVDDLVTTGATLNECAKILRENGAQEVWGLVLAKA